MNKLQKTYALAKAAYETAFKAEDWDLVDKLEDPMLEAEFALADWTFDVVVATGKMSRKDTDMIRQIAIWINGQKLSTWE